MSKQDTVKVYKYLRSLWLSFTDEERYGFTSFSNFWSGMKYFAYAYASWQNF